MTCKFYDPKDLKEIAYVKRVMEYESLFPGFAEKMQKDPEGTLKEIGIPLSVKDVSFNASTVENNNIKMHATYPGTAAEKYADFMDKKFIYRDKARLDCTPANEAMKKWRQRQIGRCAIQLGPKFNALIHVPFTIELQDGCSVGCKFCGLNAGKLQKVYEYTPENAKEFKSIISIAKEIIGDAAGQGTLYFATEPFDNPDYEKFMADYRECFGTTPQITTARAINNIERLRPLLKDINETQDVIYRFSMFNQKSVEKIFEAFTPEELILTEILPQFEEAPSSNLVKVGRNATEDECEDTISCVTGFVVNFARKSIKLSTPTWADKAHPTGEIILDYVQYTDADDFRIKIMEMISKYMKNIISPTDKIKLVDNITIKPDGDNAKIVTDKQVELAMNVNGDMTFINQLKEALSKGYRSKREIVKELCHTENGGLIRPELIHFIINKWWAMGLIVLESGDV